jgi:hypothetical protein
MCDAPMHRLLDYHRRRYGLTNGWCLRFRVTQCAITDARPHGLRCAFTLHDVDMTRLLGFDNAHGIPRRQAYDHRHRFRRPADMLPYDVAGTDELICDFFDAVERACRLEGVAFAFDAEAVELDQETDDVDEIPE